ncbi:MAG: crossover junction endodeoxyribonuclease RuvC [Actinomycetales bacterium]|nr:crossover junction endodeoxyribonuclease RuvC [Actinomycetales bacterium]
MRVLGIDPGLTRCGIGVVERTASGLSLVDCGVIKTDVDALLQDRLLQLETELKSWIERCKPDAIAVERVFSQLNVKTAMATGQAAGVALLIAARSNLPLALHTPTEVKAAVSGSGRADKKQVARMVVKILRLKSAPSPVDTTDALALAICHHWRGPGSERLNLAAKTEKKRIQSISGRRVKR